MPKEGEMRTLPWGLSLLYAAIAVGVHLQNTEIFAAETVLGYESHRWQPADPARSAERSDYRLLSPETIEDGKTYPVVLFLHGAGERGRDNKIQLKYLPTFLATPELRKKFPAFVIAPQCPRHEKWVEVDWGSGKSTPTTDEPTPSMEATIGILQHVLENYPADRSRVYLTGLSMGGYGSWDLACRHPDWFAAVTPICGGGDEQQAAKIKDLPLWAFHGDADRAVPVERSRTMIAALKAAGGSPKYTELEGVGHNSWTPAYTGEFGLLDWMFEQQR